VSELTLRGRGLSKYIGHGEALLSMEPISFFGGVNPKTGIVVERSHPLENMSIKGKVLIFPYGKGSTVGAYVLYQMSKLGTAPAAIINVKADHVTLVGCIIAQIPLVDSLDRDPFSLINNGDYVIVDGVNGLVKVSRRKF